ncbi:MAG TPA: hypothetical protein VIF84_09345 [Candidatus Limnocylindrales bacterium]|jgi:hypothetical protein
MRIYEGSPRTDFEEVLRSIGAFLDQRGMREILLVEVPDGFVVQGLAMAVTETTGWNESMGTLRKETLTFFDDDISRFMDEAAARRKAGLPAPDFSAAGHYEQALRVIGRYMDEQKPRDIFFFEQDGAYVLRLLQHAASGNQHTLAEFTRDDIDRLVSEGPALRDDKKEAAKST